MEGHSRSLPEELKTAFRVELEQYEQERQMQYITTIERMIRAEVKEEGRQEGRLEERQEMALKLLQENVDVEFIARITELSIEEIQQLQF